MTELSYCADLVRRYDRDRYLTALFAPAERREGLFSLYAFNHEIARTREVVSEATLGEIRLQWWRQALDTLYEGGRVEHEVASALGRAIHDFGLERKRFDRLIDGRAFDLGDAPPPDIHGLKRYAEETSSNLTTLACQTLGYPSGPAYLAGRHVGLGWALVGLLRAVPFHARAGRVYLPRNLLDQAGVKLDALKAGRPGKGLAGVVEVVAGVAAQSLAHAREQTKVPRDALAALLPATLGDLYLKQLATVGYDVFNVRFTKAPGSMPLRLWWNFSRRRF